ncbi:hypothetical protein HOLleu_27182 [Holothuria leucospilota]|uniref:Uncharacterized protein n=1 Tax=Holothuria leucospilota TaxID=206669 RepID=A0A9Q1BQ97_HOLLE|nr:hypothetical protein HOLleu_27182 [Holothuria leucospilota]
MVWGENGEEEIEPCEKFCERAEARCPYFLPQKPYCGQRTFFCKGQALFQQQIMGPRQNARAGQNATGRCFTCNFSLEKDEAKSVAELGCSFYLDNSTKTSAASHTRGSVHSVLVALTLYILVSWTLSPTVIAGT